MKFKYGDIVIINDKFFAGHIGIVFDYDKVYSETNRIEYEYEVHILDENQKKEIACKIYKEDQLKKIE